MVMGESIFRRGLSPRKRGWAPVRHRKCDKTKESRAFSESTRSGSLESAFAGRTLATTTPATFARGVCRCRDAARLLIGAERDLTEAAHDLLEGRLRARHII